MWHYSVFGLLVASEFEMAGLQREHPADPDVTVRRGTVPEHLTFEQATSGVLYQAGPLAFLLRIPDVARYLVQSGEEIVIEPVRDDRLDDVVVWLLGACFAALLYQRGVVCLHASAIEFSGEAVLFAGDSGVGKSTLLAAFLRQGFRMISDDICPITLDDDGKARCSPSFPMLKLRGDAAAWLEYDTTELSRVRNALEKYWVHAPAAVDPLAVRCVYILRSAGMEPVSFNSIPPLRRFDALLRYSYFTEQLKGLDLMRENFRNVAAVAGQVKVREIHRTMGPDSLNVLVKEVLGDLDGV